MGIVLSLYLYCVYSSTIIKTPDQLHWRWLKVWLASFLARWKEGLSERWSTSCCDLPFDEISERRVVQLLNWNVSSQVSFTKIFCNLLYPHLSLAWWLMTDFMVVVLCWACFSAAEMLTVVMFPTYFTKNFLLWSKKTLHDLRTFFHATVLKVGFELLGLLLQQRCLLAWRHFIRLLGGTWARVTRSKTMMNWLMTSKLNKLTNTDCVFMSLVYLLE